MTLSKNKADVFPKIRLTKIEHLRIEQLTSIKLNGCHDLNQLPKKL